MILYYYKPKINLLSPKFVTIVVFLGGGFFFFFYETLVINKLLKIKCNNAIAPCWTPVEPSLPGCSLLPP